jgi:hypothetical protein
MEVSWCIAFLDSSYHMCHGLCIAKAEANFQEDIYIRSRRWWELSNLVAATGYLAVIGCLLAIYFRRKRHISISAMVHRNYNTYFPE